MTSCQGPAPDIYKRFSIKIVEVIIMNKKYLTYGELLRRERDIEYWNLMDKWALENVRKLRSLEG